MKMACKNLSMGALQVAEINTQHLGMNKKNFSGAHGSLKSRLKLAYKLIRAVINCEQPMPYEGEHP